MNTALKQWVAGISLAQSLTSISAQAFEDIPVAYWIVANAYQVPADILYSIALTESGRRYNGKHLPWPWSLNINGESVFCASQTEAVSQMSINPLCSFTVYPTAKLKSFRE